MADQGLVQGNAVIASGPVRGADAHETRKRPAGRFPGAAAASRLITFSRDCGAILSSGDSPTASIEDLCRIHGAGLMGRKGPLRVRGMAVHYLTFASFLYAYREIFVRSVYQFRSASPAPRILDCGANIGLATLFFKLHWPQSAIECFEPDPGTFAVLRQNIEGNKLGGVKAFNTALWGCDGEIDFYLEPGIPGSLCMSAIPGRAGGMATRVPARRLSSLIGEERVDLLKLDVEGAEQAVIEDLAATGKLQLVGAIIAEYHHRVGGRSSQLSKFLGLLECSGFEYHVSAAWRPAMARRTSQDILVYAQRAEPGMWQ